VHKDVAMKRRFVSTGFTLVLLAGIAAPALAADDAVLGEVITLARGQGFNGTKPDWPVVERQAQALLDATPGEAGRTSAIRHVLGALEDGHSFYQPPSTASTSSVAGTPASKGNAARKPIAQPEATVDGVGHLVIHAWSGGVDAVGDAARTVRTALNQALASSRCGLIVDVAANGGGNMWPMMSGIAPLYDDGVLETFEQRDGGKQVVNVVNGALRMNASVFPRASLDPLPRKPPHIAVLIGPGTASSGEILALGFKGQRNVRFFGRPTAGATTANRSFFLSNGGVLALMTSHIRDRSGAVQQGPVLPDEASAEPLKTARAWLAGLCGKD
jgi:carboxyl-terminal processing protease